MLQNQGQEVFGLDASAGDDIADQSAFSDALARCRPHAVVHAAAILTTQSADDPVLAARVNCVGSTVVMHLSLAAGVDTVIYASSVAAIAPRSVYGATKAYAENLATALHAAHPGSRLIGLRFGWVYGQGRVNGWNDVMDVIRNFALEQPEAPYPDLNHALDWTYIEDAAAAVVACLERAPARAVVYDLAGDRRHITEAIEHLSRRFPATRAVPYPAVTPPTAWSELDPSALANDVGFRCSISMEEGLDRTVDAIRSAARLSAGSQVRATDA